MSNKEKQQYQYTAVDASEWKGVQSPGTDFNLWLAIALVLVVFALGFFALPAKATENDGKYRGGHHSTTVAAPIAASQAAAAAGANSTSTATGNATAVGGPATGGSVSVDNSGARTLAIGTSASANNITCYSPWLSGLFLYRDEGCAVRRDIQHLHAIGMHDAAIQRACRDPELFAAIRASGDAAKCRTVPPTLLGQ